MEYWPRGNTAQSAPKTRILRSLFQGREYLFSQLEIQSIPEFEESTFETRVSAWAFFLDFLRTGRTSFTWWEIWPGKLLRAANLSFRNPIDVSRGPAPAGDRDWKVLAAITLDTPHLSWSTGHQQWSSQSRQKKLHTQRLPSFLSSLSFEWKQVSQMTCSCPCPSVTIAWRNAHFNFQVGGY